MDHLSISTMNRNYGIDLGRFFFCFCVVCIHVPMYSNKYLMPLNRCAVPFFIITTGYFLAAKSTESFLENAKKTFFLWLKYTCIFFVLSTLLDWVFSGGIKNFNLNDVWSLLTSGNCSYLDDRFYEGKVYGFSTLWYLYSISLASFLLHFVKKYLKCSYFLYISVFFAFLGPFMNYICGYKYSDFFRLLILTIPYLSLGYWVKSSNRKCPNMIFLYVLIMLFLLLGIFEYRYVCAHEFFYQDTYISTFPLSYLFFITFSKLKVRWFAKLHLPTIITLDIYLWHRVIFFFFIVLHFSFSPFSAMVLYPITFAISYVIRRYWR